MAFVSWSTVMNGIPTDDSKFSDEDTYLTVFSTHQYGNQDKGYEAIKKLFNIIYEGPLAFNHYHSERRTPSQRLVVFEKKPCQVEQSPAPSVLKTGEIPGATI